MPEHSGGPTSRPILLLVEDERALRKVMEMVLEGEGYEVLTAENGREGLEVLANTRPDLIITDFMMPEMDGAQMIREIKNNSSLAKVPILLMSAAFPPDLPEKGIADLFLEKGGELSGLLENIRALLAFGQSPRDPS